MLSATAAAVTPTSYSRALPSGKVRETDAIWALLVSLAPTKRPVAGEKVPRPFA